MSKPKVYGWTSAPIGGKQYRVIVAATNWRLAIDAARSVGDLVTESYAKKYGGITENERELEAALAQPDVALARPLDDRGAYVPLADVINQAREGSSMSTSTTDEAKAELAEAGISPDAMPSGADEAQSAVPTIPKRAYHAVAAVGEKFAELTDEQKTRAARADSEKSGLRGKALGRWIIGGGAALEQDRQAGRESADRKATEAKAARVEAAKDAPSRQEKAAARTAYPDNIRAAVKRANAIRGKSHGAGPKQHVHVRDAVTRELAAQKAEPTPLALAQLAGFKSVAELHAAAAGEVDRKDLAVMHPLAAKMGDDQWCKGRHLAAALAAWGEELQAAAKAAK